VEAPPVRHRRSFSSVPKSRVLGRVLWWAGGPVFYGFRPEMSRLVLKPKPVSLFRQNISYTQTENQKLNMFIPE
jgi:hypothetical protein